MKCDWVKEGFVFIKQHRRKLCLFLGFSVIFGCALVYGIFVDTQNVKFLISIPATGSLLSALFVLLRDDISHERQLELKWREQYFSLGVTSHMASVAFDKHVEFCEEYITCLNTGLIDLNRDGPSTRVHDLAKSLASIRKKHQTWVTREIYKKVESFENSLFQMGSDAYAIKSGIKEKRGISLIDRMFETFSIVTECQTGSESESHENVDDQRKIGYVINGLQDILGITELTELRRVFLDKAMVREE